MIDVRLDAEGDIPESGNLDEVEGYDCVAQLANIEFSILLGTYFANLQRGFALIEIADRVPASQAIAGQKFERLKVIREVNRAALRIPGITSCTVDSVAFDSGSRQLEAVATLNTAEGLSITITYSTQVL